VLLEPGAAPIEGRQALLEMARTMTPLSSVVIAPTRTKGQPTVAYTYGSASWVNGRPPNAGSTTQVRVVMIWQRQADGVWRIALEAFSPEASNQWTIKSQVRTAAAPALSSIGRRQENKP
jgi:ketosteroid isomerase-like protein